MKESKNQKFLFTMWLILAFLSIATLLISLFNMAFILTNLIVIFFIFIAVISFIISTISIRQLIIDFRISKEENVKNESNIRSYYMYEQLLDPPEMNT
jgi:hypothetical protein